MLKYKMYYCIFYGDVFLEEIVYLDNSATTKPCEAAVKAVNEALLYNWGNPSSLYRMGYEAESAVTNAREKVALALSCRADEIVFNSCGTEGDNTVILGIANARKKRGNRIVTTAVEHHAVLNTLKRLENEGFEIIYLKPDENGYISEQDIFDAINEKTILVSIMLVNNEIGAVYPVKAAARAIKQKNAPALLHTDAVQAFGKIPIDVKDLGVDLLTLSGHKIHAPKGIGALYIKKGVNLPALITGGGQEKGLRSGTESVPLICGLAAAVESLPDIKTQLKKQEELCNYAKGQLSGISGVKFNSPDDAIPYIINFSLPGYRSETLLHFLESEGICVSSGSACAKGEGSHVLNAMGLSKKYVDSALRVSFSRDNTFADVDALCTALISATKKLRRTN